MNRRLTRSLLRGLIATLCILALRAQAEPYLAVQQGFKCGQCHVNPTGGGLRTAFGDAFAQTQMPAKHLDTGTDTWTGDITKFLRVGGNLRYDGSVRQVPHTKNVDQFELEQTRLYLEANVIPERLLVYVDELVAPGGAQNREAYGVYWSAAHDWYVKAGQMYLPFGWRLQDQSAFTRQVTGISMAAPDQGLEVGWLRGHWDTQLVVSNGTAGGPVTDNGKQYSGQLMYVESSWRLGLAANHNDKSAGDKNAYGLFGGIRTGPVAWLAEADLVEDKSFANGEHRMAATLLEANWLLSRGNNLKITNEFANLDRSAHHNGQTRWSVVYELTPIQFMQLRAGVRYYDGIPQLNAQYAKLYFVQFHGFF